MASSTKTIPHQEQISWAIAFTVSVAGLKRRFLRSMITMSGVILAIAFLAYMLTVDAVHAHLVDGYYALVEEGKTDQAGELQELLHAASVELQGAGTDNMMVMLIILSLLICLVGIVNSMLMSVTERVKEIGTLKCLGALDGFIVRTYFIESSLQGVIGTLLGMLIGVVVAVGVSLYNFASFVFAHFPLLDTITGLAITLVTGSALSVVAAIGPAYAAARKEPVEAMRVEE